jgi:hypothetical protein
VTALADDAWDAIVGIDLNDWMRADSGEQVRWLAHLRDHPMAEQGPRPRVTCDACIEVADFGSRRVRRIPGHDCRHR